MNDIVGDVAWEVVSSYCPQTGRSALEKEEFYELMDTGLTSEKVLVGGDFCNVDGFGGDHGRF